MLREDAGGVLDRLGYQAAKCAPDTEPGGAGIT